MTGSHSSLEFDLLEQADPGALVQAIANLALAIEEQEKVIGRTKATSTSILYSPNRTSGRCDIKS